jgi:hypothetical protein
MFPVLRGGNDNQVPKESFLGEVQDVVAAAGHLEDLPYVDSDRIYLGGHSTGGTLALLVAECSDRFRAVCSVPSSMSRGTVRSTSRSTRKIPQKLNCGRPAIGSTRSNLRCSYSKALYRPATSCRCARWRAFQKQQCALSRSSGCEPLQHSRARQRGHCQEDCARLGALNT